jgi:hypothetical protein
VRCLDCLDYRIRAWAEYEDKEFDGGVDQLDLPWTPERKDELTSGRANPTAKELQQWREASCRWASNFTDWSHPAWIVPLRPLGQIIEGYALFPCEPDAPWLEGINESAEEAKVAFARIGAIEGTVDSDAKCNPVDSIGSSTKSRVSHSERQPSARFPGDKDGSARRNIEPLQ